MKNACIFGLILILSLLIQASRSETAFGQISSMRVTPKPRPALRNPGSDILVTVFDAEDGKPISNAKLTYSDRHDAPTFKSDANGEVRIEYEKIKDIMLWQASFWITAPDHGSFYHNWDSLREAGDGEGDAKVESRYTIKLARYTHLQGTLLNEQKQPIENATITITYCVENNQSHNIKTADAPLSATVQTNANGQWVCNIPGSMAITDIVPSHPNYAKQMRRDGIAQTMESSTFYSNRAMRSRFLPGFTQTLHRGTDVTIRVTDEQGRSVVGASVIDAANSYFNPLPANVFTTDSHGTVRLSQCNLGIRHFVVKGNGYAPQGEQINVTETPETYSFQINRGRKLAVQVVDKDGQPISNVEVTLRTQEPLPYSSPWYGDDIPRQTNADGLWVWDHAPQKEGTLEFFRDDYVRYYGILVDANLNEYKHVMQKKCVIKGRVIDAETKQPVERFEALLALKSQSSPSVSYYPCNSSLIQTQVATLPTQQPTSPFSRATSFFPQHHDGKYKCEWQNPFESLSVRIIAPGYDIADSPIVRMGEEERTFDFELNRNPNITGIVSMDGKPIANVEIAVGSKGNPIYIVNGKIDRQQTKVVVTSDQNGRFAFPVIDGQYTLAAMSNEGYSITRMEEFHFNREVVLLPFSPWQSNMAVPIGRVNMLAFGKGGHETLDGYFIDIRYDWKIDESGKNRVIYNSLSQYGEQTSLYVPLR